MKLKNVLLLGLSFVLVAVLAIGGTVAYLTNTDDDVNVMTFGNVSIAQHEYERIQNADGSYEMVTSAKYGEGYKLQKFTQAKPLYPATGAITGWGGIVPFDQIKGASGSQAVFAGLNNVQDKFVLVENTGKSDAYVRTLIALEYGSNTKDIIGISTGDFWTWNGIGIVEIDSNNYYLFEAVYKGSNSLHIGGVLPAGEYTYNSLGQIYLKNEATNEDCDALDGNDNGTYDILVLSQAVQTEGFDNAQTALNTAFGEINAVNAAEWFDSMIIPAYATGAEQVEKVFKNGGELFLQEDVSSDTYTVSEGVKVDIDLQDNTLSGIVNNMGEMNVSGGKMEADYVNNYGNATFSNVEIKAGTSANYASVGREGAVTEYNEVTIISAGGGIGVADGAKTIFNSASVYVDSPSTSGRYIFYAEGAGSEIIINGGNFSWDPKDNQKRAYIYAGVGTTVTINGGTFGKASTRSGYTDGILGDGTVIVKGGTFGFDPTAWVADGYEAVKNDGIWTVIAK